MEIDPVRIFVKVVQTGGFSKAADALRLPKSTVSRTISQLEHETGTKLIVRTTRSLTPTAAGLAFYESASGPVQSLEEALRSLRGRDSVIAGNLRLTAPEDFGGYVISPAIARLSREHRELSFELHYTDEVLDLVRGGYDFAVRLGKLPPSRFKVKKLAEVVLITVASPDYLSTRPKIRSPQDLASHDCLAYRPKIAHPKWLLHGEGKSVQVAIRPKIAANMMTSLIAMAKQGAGVALIPKYLCQKEISSGELVRVLPGWTEATFPVHLVTPSGSSASSRLKVISAAIAKSVESAIR